MASSTLGILKISISQTFLMFRLIYHAILLPTVHPYRESTGWPQQWTSWDHSFIGAFHTDLFICDICNGLALFWVGDFPSLGLFIHHRHHHHLPPLLHLPHLHRHSPPVWVSLMGMHHRLPTKIETGGIQYYSTNKDWDIPVTTIVGPLWFQVLKDTIQYLYIFHVSLDI